MKKYAAIIGSVALILFGACTTMTSDKSYSEALKGNYTLKYYGYVDSDKTVERAIVSALRERGWTITNPTLPLITAFINRKGQNAKVAVSFKDSTIVFDSKGSMSDGKPYVPIRYIDYAVKSINSNLRRDQ